MQDQFIQQHKGGFQGNLAVARVPEFAVAYLRNRFIVIIVILPWWSYWNADHEVYTYLQEIVKYIYGNCGCVRQWIHGRIRQNAP